MRSYLKEAKRVLKESSDYLIPENGEVYSKIIRDLSSPFKNMRIDKVVAIDMKGLMYGPVVANKLKVGFTPLLKGNKIKNREKVIVGKKFTDYSGKEKSMEVFKESIKRGERILLIDDWFDSGNTGKAAIELIEARGGKVVGISVIFNQLKEKDEELFNKYNYHYLIRLEPKK